MTDAEYVAAIPDIRLRTAISGYLMRKGWKVYKRQLAEIEKEENEEIEC